ncbi:MAG TPA: hypothetical protein VND65_12485 [Candidatus Binatia bacterium]|nr:hypothetical protein [Candidatus Binatia bacterium]
MNSRVSKIVALLMFGIFFAGIGCALLVAHPAAGACHHQLPGSSPSRCCIASSHPAAVVAVSSGQPLLSRVEALSSSTCADLVACSDPVSIESGAAAPGALPLRI